uniref:Uncharacterized protein n=1 Tax=Ciona savignyi TaxID=51511 RepID=H2YJM8_CIOSA
MNLASNIIFSNGELDPWKDGGVLHDLSPTLVALLVEEGAHHLDLRGSNPDDPASVIKVRQQELEIIKGWIAQHWAKKLGNTRGLKSYTQKQIEDVVRKVRWRKMT